MNLGVKPYLVQQESWPKSGRHILAHFDDRTIVVYQAYSSVIGNYAVKNGRFGDGFSYNRMSWIKPNFLWMMYRSDWGRSQNQELILGIRLSRQFFDSLLEQAVPSSFAPILYSSEQEWKAAVARSNVRLQWDPDHRPDGHTVERRAIQLGLRGETLKAYGMQEMIEVIDMSGFVAQQRENARNSAFSDLLIPEERVYYPASERAARQVGLDAVES